MQRTYGVDMDRVLDGTVSVRQAAALAACLQPGSLCLGGPDEAAGWTRGELLSLATLNTVRAMAGADPMDPFSKPDAQAMDVEDMIEYLARPRVEAEGRG